MKNDRSGISYSAYVRMWGEWEAKGYHMEELLNFNEYKEHVYYNALKMGKKNIAREVASTQRSWNLHQINEIIGRLEKENILDKDYKKELKSTIKSSSRKEIFHALAGADYEDREFSERIIYG